MKSEKKCPHCGQWTEWQQHIDDKCQHCGKYLQEEARQDEVKAENRRKQLEEQFKKYWPFDVKPSDPFIIKGLKWTGYGIYMVFVGIISLIAWLVFWLGF